MTSTHNLANDSAIVVGASRGLGLGVALALADDGARVTAVARTAMAAVAPSGLAPTNAHTIPEQADATDAAVAARLIHDRDPSLLVLVAGATPLMRPLQDHTWETFSANWETDVQLTFHWLRAALLTPLRPGSRVIVFSSGAALQGSPLSGGYAGAKATQRFMTGYAQDEANRAGLGVTFTAVLPRLTPLTDLGRPAVAAYAQRGGISEAEYLERFGTPLTPEMAGAAVLELVGTDTSELAPDYLLTGDGLQPITARRSPMLGTPR